MRFVKLRDAVKMFSLAEHRFYQVIARLLENYITLCGSDCPDVLLKDQSRLMGAAVQLVTILYEVARASDANFLKILVKFNIPIYLFELMRFSNFENISSQFYINAAIIYRNYTALPATTNILAQL